jgi:uncharacterized protein YjbJ (UPF0337 family)
MQINRRNAMNADILQGKWKQVRGEMKQWWGNLTDDDLEQIDGHKDKLIGKVQERYGYARDRAEQEVDHRLDQFEKAMKN